MPHRTHTPSGFTLLELLAVLAILAVFMNLGAAIFVATTRMNIVANERLDRIAQRERIAEAFTVSADRADAVVEHVGNFVSDARHVVFRMPGKDGQAQYVVFGPWENGAGWGKTILREGPKGLRVYTTVKYQPEGEGITFTYDRDVSTSPRRITLRLPYKTKSDHGDAYVVTAALGAVGEPAS